MAKLYKINEGKMLLGVCTGLGASGGASVTTWRLIFALSSLFLFFPIVILDQMNILLFILKILKGIRLKIILQKIFSGGEEEKNIIAL